MEAGGAGEHQHREAVATRLGPWRGPLRLTATAAKHQDGRNRGNDDRPSNGAASGGKGKAAHDSQGTATSYVLPVCARPRHGIVTRRRPTRLPASAVTRSEGGFQRLLRILR